MKTIDGHFPELTETHKNSFVFVKDNALTLECCNELIEFFEKETTRKHPGVIGGGTVNREIKDSLDHKISPNSSPEAKRFDEILCKSLQEALVDLHKKYEFKIPRDMLATDTGYQIQKTTPGGFYKWHIDVGPHNLSRQLVFIWYLNEVLAGGCTGFEYQDVKVRPRPGRLVLFPCMWTHRHCGFPVREGAKYIITGWVFCKKAQQAKEG